MLVPNGNPPSDRSWLEGFWARHTSTTLVDAGGNIGFGRGVNLGVSHASHDVLLVINPDAAIRRRSISPMLETAATMRSPWIVGGRIFDVAGHEERGPRRKRLTLTRAMTSFVGWNTWTLEKKPPPSAPIDMDVISGAFFLTDRTSFNTLNGFDEGYFLHVEDVDLCRRAWEAGGQVCYDPRAGALHYGATSNAPSLVVAAHKADSLARYFHKFASGPVERLAVSVLVPVLRWATLLRAR